MWDIPTKVANNGATMAGKHKASEFNNHTLELEKAVTHTGVALTSYPVDPDATPDSNTDMLAESIARCVSKAPWGECSGTANTYVVAAPTNLIPPKALFDGLEIETVINVTNTGASTANVFGLGAKAVRTWDDKALTGSELAGARPTVWRYSSAANGAAGAWLIRPWGTSQITRGNSMSNPTGLNIVTATYTTVTGTWSISKQEIGGMSTSGSITIPASMPDTWYMIVAYGAFTSGGTITRPYMGIMIDGAAAASTISPDGSSQPMNLSVVRKLSAGQVITLEVWHNSGANRQFENVRLDMMLFG